MLRNLVRIQTSSKLSWQMPSCVEQQRGIQGDSADELTDANAYHAGTSEACLLFYGHGFATKFAATHLCFTHFSAQNPQALQDLPQTLCSRQKLSHAAAMPALPCAARCRVLTRARHLFLVAVTVQDARSREQGAAPLRLHGDSAGFATV